MSSLWHIAPNDTVARTCVICSRLPVALFAAGTQARSSARDGNVDDDVCTVFVLPRNIRPPYGSYATFSTADGITIRLFSTQLP